MQITKKHHSKEVVISERSLFGNAQIPVSGGNGVSAMTNLIAIQCIESPYAGYNPFAVEKNDLRAFPSYPFGDHLEVYGKVMEARDNEPIKNCLLEVWHLSPNSSKFNHRAKLLTNAIGEYHFITDRPGRARGENYNIYFKVSKGDRSYFTKLAFNNIQAFIWGLHSHQNNSSCNELPPVRKKNSVGKTTIAFNLNLL